MVFWSAVYYGYELPKHHLRVNLIIMLRITQKPHINCTHVKCSLHNQVAVCKSNTRWKLFPLLPRNIGERKTQFIKKRRKNLSRLEYGGKKEERKVMSRGKKSLKYSTENAVQ
jgi:hypothetical protein